MLPESRRSITDQKNDIPAPQSDPALHLSTNNPYQTPATEVPTKRSLTWPVPLLIAICIWPLLTFKIYFSGMMLETWGFEFGMVLPTLSLILIHPMMSLFVFTATISILFSAFSLKKPSQRRKLGHIACILGLLVLATAILGLIVPMVEIAFNMM